MAYIIMWGWLRYFIEWYLIKLKLVKRDYKKFIETKNVILLIKLRIFHELLNIV